jgi:type II secretory pathway component PulF
MSMLLGAGTGVVPALAAVETELRGPLWGSALASVREEVEQGAALSAAMGQCPHLFDGVFRSIVAAGEATATLPEMFSRLAALSRQQLEVRNRVIAALTYPAVLCVISLAVTCVLMGFVLPRFAGLFSTLRVELPSSTVFLLNLSSLVRTHWIETSVVAGVGLVAFSVYIRTRAGVELIRRSMLILPGIRSVVRMLVLARICRILGLMIQSRVPLIDAISLTTDATGYPSYRNLLVRARENVSRGESMAQALADPSLMPTAVVQAVAAGEQSGKLGDALSFIADCYDEDNRHRIALVSRIIEPAILVLLGLVVGTVAVSLFIPLFDLATAAGG